jgi:CheY-like chemotaxis protein
MATPITHEKQKLKILVVDDEYDVAMTLKTILEEERRKQ